MVGPIRTIPGKEQTQRHQLGEKQTQFSLFWRGTATSQEWWRASSKWRIGSIRNSSIHMCSSTKKISLKILKSAPRLHTRCSDSQHDIIIPRRWTTEVTSTNCSYGKIPHDHWFQPDWIDETKATASRLDMIENNVCRRFLPNFSVNAHNLHFILRPDHLWRLVSARTSGDQRYSQHSSFSLRSSVPYRNMCRFYSGVRIWVDNIVGPTHLTGSLWYSFSSAMNF